MMPDEQLLWQVRENCLMSKKNKVDGLGNILFLGHLDKDEPNIEISNSKAIILPSQVYEVFLMVIVEVYALISSHSWRHREYGHFY
jgi:hypothetical protein